MSGHISNTIQFIPPRLGRRMNQGFSVNSDLDPAAEGYPEKAIADKEGREAKRLRLAYEERIQMEEDWAARGGGRLL